MTNWNSLFLCVAAYLIFGSWLNYNRYGARGWDLLPHADTLRDVPYIFNDWLRRVINTIQGSGGSRSGYAAVWIILYRFFGLLFQRLVILSTYVRPFLNSSNFTAVKHFRLLCVCICMNEHFFFFFFFFYSFLLHFHLLVFRRIVLFFLVETLAWWESWDRFGSAPGIFWIDLMIWNR